MRPLLASILLLIVAAPAEAEEVERTSQPVRPRTEALEGWREPGFRLEVHLGWQLLHAATRADAFSTPRGGGLSFGIEPGLRLSRALALSAGLRYAAVPGAERLNGRDLYESRSGGVSWSVTADLTWFPADQFFLGAGLGYAGVLTDCRADGVTAFVRGGAQAVVGPAFAMGPVVQAGLTATRCSARSAYLHDTVVLAWAFAWR